MSGRDSPASERALLPGQVLLGKYRITQKLGEGGFGRVYEAEELEGGRRLALKVGRSRLHEERMAREARLAASLQNRYSVRVFGLELLDDESPVIVMELLEGISLREYLAMRGRVELHLVLRWAQQLAEVLRDAHALGLVHRDLKPSNLFLVGSEDEAEIRLLDFGLARSPERASEASLTASDVVVGSPAYLAPEVIRAAQASPRSDIWSFGVVLYELLAGHRPFRADTNAGLFAVIAADPPEPLAASRPGLPVGLYRLVERCLAKQLDERPADMQAVLRALESIESVDAGRGETSTTATVIAEPRAVVPRRRRLVAGVVLAVASLLLGAALLGERAITASRDGASALSPNAAAGTLPVAPEALERGPRAMPLPSSASTAAPRAESTSSAAPSARPTPSAPERRDAPGAPRTTVRVQSAKPAGSEPLFLLTEPDY